nr:protein LURP-one-related 11-like [Ipomoea batatas]
MTSKRETFTVWMKSLVYHGNGCTVFDSNGEIVYRIDNYNTKCSREVHLMDLHGRVLFSIRQKKLAVFGRWDGYRLGNTEVIDEEILCFRVKRSRNVFRGDSNHYCVNLACDQPEESCYKIIALPGKSTFKIVSRSRLVAEIPRPFLASRRAYFPDEIFLYCLALALVPSLLLFPSFPPTRLSNFPSCLQARRGSCCFLIAFQSQLWPIAFRLVFLQHAFSRFQAVWIFRTASVLFDPTSYLLDWRSSFASANALIASFLLASNVDVICTESLLNSSCSLSAVLAFCHRVFLSASSAHHSPSPRSGHRVHSPWQIASLVRSPSPQSGLRVHSPWHTKLSIRTAFSAVPAVGFVPLDAASHGFPASGSRNQVRAVPSAFLARPYLFDRSLVRFGASSDIFDLPERFMISLFFCSNSSSRSRTARINSEFESCVFSSYFASSKRLREALSFSHSSLNASRSSLRITISLERSCPRLLSFTICLRSVCSSSSDTSACLATATSSDLSFSTSSGISSDPLKLTSREVLEESSVLPSRVDAPIHSHRDLWCSSIAGTPPTVWSLQVLLFFIRRSRGVSSPELHSELDKVISDSLDALRPFNLPTSEMFLFTGVSCQATKMLAVAT